MGNAPSQPSTSRQLYAEDGAGRGRDWPHTAYPYPYPGTAPQNRGGTGGVPHHPWNPYAAQGNPHNANGHMGTQPPAWYPAAYPSSYHYPAGHPSGYPAAGQWFPPGYLPGFGLGPPPGAAVEHVKEIQTVRNPVNVKRSSVRLERDAADPRRHVVCFTFDATVSGKIGIFFVAQEGEACSFALRHLDLHPSAVLTFSRGLNQKFRQPLDAALDLSLFPEEELLGVGPTTGGQEVYPLVICMVTRPAGADAGPAGAARGASGEAPPAEADDLGDVVEPGRPLSPSVQAQMTYAVLVKRRGPGATSAGLPGEAHLAAPEDSGGRGTVASGAAAPAPASVSGGGLSVPSLEPLYDVRVLKQRIWVNGAEYDLQEIYGMEDYAANAGALGAQGVAEPATGAAGGGAVGTDGGDRGRPGEAGAGGVHREAADGEPSSAAGAASGSARGSSTESSVGAGECVICLSAPRDTTVLPCRHMCMCGECAEVLRFQSNKCPICRHTVEGLLQIKIAPRAHLSATPKATTAAEGAGAAAAAGAAAGSAGSAAAEPMARPQQEDGVQGASKQAAAGRVRGGADGSSSVDDSSEGGLGVRAGGLPLGPCSETGTVDGSIARSGAEPVARPGLADGDGAHATTWSQRESPFPSSSVGNGPAAPAAAIASRQHDAQPAGTLAVPIAACDSFLFH